MKSGDAVALSEMFKDFGIGEGEPQRTATEALVEAGVISGRPNRTSIAASKLDSARQALEAAFVLHCTRGDCRAHAIAEAERRGVERLVAQRLCSVCGGSPDRKALQRLVTSLDATDVRRITVVGGTPEKWREIQGSCPPGIEWRFVDGRGAKPDRFYRDTRKWAHVIVVWASTPLHHKVSWHFTGKGDDRVVVVSERGIGALCDAVIAHVGRRC